MSDVYRNNVYTTSALVATTLLTSISFLPISFENDCWSLITHKQRMFHYS